VSHPTEELTALHDGALPPPRAAELRRHLEGCAACRAEAARLAAAAAVLASLPAAPEPSPFFSARLAARLEAERQRPRGLLGPLAALRWRLAAPAVGLAAVAAAGVLWLRPEPPAPALLLAHLDLLAEYEVVASVGEIESAEDVAVIAALGEEGAP